MKLTPEAITRIKVALHAGFAAALVWFVQATLRDALGPDPVQAMLLFCGRMAIIALLLTLAVSPLARAIGHQSIIKVRRLCGLWCFVWATFHLLVFFTFVVELSFSKLLAEIALHPFLALGGTAWIIFLLMAMTSSLWAMQLLRKGWKRLHQFIYLAMILVGTHALMAGKTSSFYAKIFATIGAVLLLERVIRKVKKP